MKEITAATQPKELSKVGPIVTQVDALKPLRAGDRCPNCQIGQLDYDGMLNLACEVCGYGEAGCFT